MSKHELILALETSSRVGSVALALGPRLLAQTTFSAPMRHSAEIFGAIEALMHRFDRHPEQLDHIYVSVGPGSFTGLRISITIAKAMHIAKHTRIVAVDTLDVIAANAPTTEHGRPIDTIATILDAKRDQFYIAAYQRRIDPGNTSPGATSDTRYITSDIRHPTYKTWQRLIPDSLMTATQFLDTFADPANPIILLGDGLLYHKHKFQSPGAGILHEQYWSPQAANVHALGYQSAIAQHFADPLRLSPSYIRRPEAEVKWQQR
ncbi:MAG: tRNA (adenosine(37)-N6)-threonylcarbamoyltransferase complex dimerization subunit type 1 TsaB [Sedimentisphaerales bacterium]|nr:tRNA (adenosine(37)-N6)-threonylcarbamoyltransferase complex dimerization subunit type 1 TsaB [Sedimentisphaerales bacterium]